MIKYKPGQLFEDKDHLLHTEKDLCFAYLLLSLDQEEDGAEYWKCAVFMDYKHGAFMRLLTEDELLPLHYIGYIEDLQKESLNGRNR